MKFKYGRSQIDVNLPHNINWQLLKKELPPFPPQEELVRVAVDSLVDQLDKTTAKKRDLLLIVPDHTRRCGLEIILPILIPQLEKKFACEIRILVANGSHLLQPEETIIDLVGKEIYDSYAVVQHDARDDSALYLAGSTTNGTPVWLNRMVVEADFVITIGGILYHYFAGFGGGPKMLMPGVAGYETIRLNHKRTIDPVSGRFHPQCYEGNIDTNPVYSDLVQVLDFVPNVLSLQMALGLNGEIIYAQAGPVVETQRAVCEQVRMAYDIPIDTKADLVLASAGGFPSDVNLVQTHKSIHHAFQAVKPGGTIILFAECSEGAGSQTFTPYLEYGSSEEIGRVLLKDYKINGHTALTLRAKAEQAMIILISSLEDGLVRKAGMMPAHSFDEAWEIARADLPDQSLGYVLEKASALVPVLAGEL